MNKLVALENKISVSHNHYLSEEFICKSSSVMESGVIVEPGHVGCGRDIKSWGIFHTRVCKIFKFFPIVRVFNQGSSATEFNTVTFISSVHTLCWF